MSKHIRCQTSNILLLGVQFLKKYVVLNYDEKYFFLQFLQILHKTTTNQSTSQYLKSTILLLSAGAAMATKAHFSFFKEGGLTLSWTRLIGQKAFCQ